MQHQPSLLDGEVKVTIRAERHLTKRTYRVTARVPEAQTHDIELYRFLIDKAHKDWPSQL